MLQIPQTAMNDPRGPAGGAGRKILLFDQQSAPAGASAFSRNGHAVDPAPNHNYLEVFVFQRAPDCARRVHGISRDGNLSQIRKLKFLLPPVPSGR
jgi:hypothetical protein